MISNFGRYLGKASLKQEHSMASYVPLKFCIKPVLYDDDHGDPIKGARLIIQDEIHKEIE